MDTRTLARAASIAGCAFMLAACGGPADEGRTTGVEDETAQSAAPAGEAPAAEPAAAVSPAPAEPAGPTLRPAYLEGEWCFAYTDLGQGNRREQGIAYVFAADGKLTYQREGDSDRMDPGSYAIEGDMIDLRPMFMVYDLRIDAVEDDEFVLKGLGRHHFIRGPCPEEKPIDGSK